MNEAGAGEHLLVIAREEDAVALAARAGRAEALAVDVEANGLFAYRARLCTVQLAFAEQGRMVIAVVDTLAVPVAPLAGLLGPEGPPKILHDLSFDARLLAETGAPLGCARDTSVAARFLGHTATGLAAICAAELGVQLDKQRQQHDWGKRPLGAEDLAYLADDVRHLLALDDRLRARVAALGIEDEVAAECAWKLASASRPPRDARPGYVRVKGAADLDAAGRAILRRLVDARERVAEAEDRPPFKIVSNEVLLEVARKRPASVEALRKLRGGDHAARWTDAWLRAVDEGLRDGDIPEEDRAHFEPARVDRRAIAQRRALEARFTAWRRAEAKARGVDEQVVLPGHCAQDLVELALTTPPDAAQVREAIARIPGLGHRRLERYAELLVALTLAPAPPPDPPKSKPWP